MIRRPWHRKVAPYLPTRRNLKGGWLHRLVGERLFDPPLWKSTPHGIAGGLALGTFIALTPTLGVHAILVVVFAFFLRVNIPAALIACMITNPLTAPVIYPLEYELGLWLAGPPGPEEIAAYSTRMQSFARYAKPLWVGSVVSGVVGAALAYGIGIWIHRVWARARARRSRGEPAEKGADPSLP